MTKTIMLIHAEGNLHVNPSLTGIVELLCEHGYLVHYYCPRLAGTSPAPPCAGVRYVFFDKNSLRPVDRYCLIIGVDRDGIIIAEMVSRAVGAPYGLISYELFFADEAGESFKRPEIAACANLQFAVCQDEERSRHLAAENRIPPAKIINVPVAGRCVRRSQRNASLSTALGLSTDIKIVLYIGSITVKWAMTNELILNTERWEDDWALVLHSRYDDPAMERLIHSCKHQKRVYFSPQCGLPFDAMQTLVKSADLGVALYQPTFANIYEGNNLKYLGLSSGKIATYLQHGVPIVVNDIGEMSTHADTFQLGIHIHDLDELPERLRNTDRVTLDRWRENCYQFFQQNLDLEARIGPLLEVIRTCADPAEG